MSAGKATSASSIGAMCGADNAGVPSGAACRGRGWADWESGWKRVSVAGWRMGVRRFMCMHSDGDRSALASENLDHGVVENSRFLG